MKMLIVLNDKFQSSRLLYVLQSLGHDVIGRVKSGEEAIALTNRMVPDMIYIGVDLSGQLDGLQTAKLLNMGAKIPIVFLTNEVDVENFKQIKSALPLGIICTSKGDVRFRRRVEILANNIKRPFVLELVCSKRLKESESIFVRDKNKMVKLNVSDILFSKAERNYCRIFTKAKVYLLSIPLKAFESKVKNSNLMRIHRSFLINIRAIDALNDCYVFIKGESIPISKSYKLALDNRLIQI